MYSAYIERGERKPDLPDAPRSTGAGRRVLMRKTRIILSAAVGCALATAALWAQDDPSSRNLTRQMQLAIQYYEKGDDMQAMDRFMDILTRGDPAERSLANEYINLITRRMNTGEKVPTEPASRRENPALTEASAPRATAAAPITAARAPEILVESAKPGTVAAPAVVKAAPAPAPVQIVPAPPRRVAPEPEAPPADKGLMKKEIKAKIRGGVEAGLKALRAVEGVKVLMMENGDPQAVAIPSSLLFQQGIAFQKDAGAILDGLTRMIFGLGSAQAVILPEGTAIGDAKILDMRRTMGISSHFFSAGIAPARIKVNLLNAQVDIPRPLMDFRGIVILFVYNQPLNLNVDTALGEEGGPPVSMGIYPPSFRPDRNEGVIIEFSVQDPPAGLVSWKFQLLQPTQGDVRDLAPLQDVAGGSPVFHQIYWNGRQNYFGSPLPAGRYECVLTATDAKNRQRTLHRWIQLIDAAGNTAPPPPAVTVTPAASAPASAALVAAAPTGAPSSELAPAESSESLVAGKAKAAGKAGKAAKGAKKKAQAAPAESEETASADDAAAPVKAAPKPTKPAAGSYELLFTKNTHQLTREAERTLETVAETMVYYPMENLKIVGYSQSAEKDAAGLAERRAQMVASLLINKYQIDPKKIQITSSVVETAKHAVVIDFLKNE